MSLINTLKIRNLKEVEIGAKEENVSLEKLRKLIIEGKVVMPRNPIHSPKPLFIGEGLRVKVNTNIGTSPEYANFDEEIEKARIALKYGTDTLMDLSIGGSIEEITSFRKKILKKLNIPIGTVPIYEAGLNAIKKGSIFEMNEDTIFNSIEKHAKEGVDFMTVHCGVTKESISCLRKQKRVAQVVSRGGSMLAVWIMHNEKENPLYSNYDYLLELAEKYDFTLSLGDGLRPGCIADATDRAQIQELLIIGELVKRAREKGVQSMVEGPGHIPINQIEANVRIEKTVCNGAPFYVLGPLVTDIAPGYDHITAAIGGAIAGYYGADFLCYVTPTEHLSLPTVEDVKEGVIASRIAAHAADISHGREKESDLKIAEARKELDWERQFKCSIDPEKSTRVRSRRKPVIDKKTCSMCGYLCAFNFSRMLEKYISTKQCI
ncbi:MAG: phosphomethylpyrimidine synthase ThiC [Candidatus Thermoplasmatota archaeon]